MPPATLPAFPPEIGCEQKATGLQELGKICNKNIPLIMNIIKPGGKGSSKALQALSLTERQGGLLWRKGGLGRQKDGSHDLTEHISFLYSVQSQSGTPLSSLPHCILTM
jgi:hypothetical protein